MTQKLASTDHWPSPMQRLLLQAALLPGDQAEEAWKVWLAQQEIDAIDTESFMILPQLYLNLTRNGIRDQYTERLKGVYRQTWARNQLALRRLASAIEVLDGEGIRSVVTKGMSLAMFSYCDLGGRIMFDCDLAVMEDARAGPLRKEVWTVPEDGYESCFTHGPLKVRMVRKSTCIAECSVLKSLRSTTRKSITARSSESTTGSTSAFLTPSTLC